MTKISQLQTVTLVRQWMNDHFIGTRIETRCVHWAFATCIVLKKQGLYPVIQAGSAQFRRDSEDPMERFSYIFEGLHNPRVMRQMQAGKLPEMHAWAGLPASQEIVDVTTSYQKAQCNDLMPGMKFDFDHADYFWEKAGNIDSNSPVVYEPSEEATGFVLGLIQMETKALTKKGKAELIECCIPESIRI